MVAQVADQGPDDQRKGQASCGSEQAQDASGQQREPMRPHVAVHDPPPGPFPAGAPAYPGSHPDLARHPGLRSSAMPSVSPGQPRAAKVLSAAPQAAASPAVLTD